MRIEAYAGSSALGIKSEAYYSVRPTGVPTVKYGDKEISTTDANLPNRYFYGSIELTVEAPDGYEVWYLVGDRPSESNMGNKVQNGKVTITDSGSNGILFFKLAKAFTVDGREYRKLSHQYTSVHLSKIETLPAPKVTVTTKEGGQTLIPSGNTYTMTENIVTVTLESTMNWPLNATIAYDTNGNGSPTFSTGYTKPFEVRGAGTIAVFTLVPKADGGYDYKRTAYTFKLAESLEKVPVSTYNSSTCTAYYTDENGVERKITSFSQELKVGTRVRVVPKTPTGQAFKKWEIGNYLEHNIWENTIDGPYNPELIFHVPKPINDYNGKPKTLTITATFAEASEANISGVTKVDLVMNKTVGESISLNYSNKAMRTISYQWWVGNSVGAEGDALPGAVSFDPDKTYTVKVTIKANPGASFTSTAGVEFGNWGEHFTVPNGKITRTDKDTLTFTATPIRQINLTMPAPLTVGDSLPTISDVEGVPAGVTAQALTWPYTTGNTVPDAAKVYAALTLKTDGTRPFMVGVSEYKHLTVNGDIVCQYARNSSNDYVTDGSKVTINIDLPVKAKGVEVSGTITSYGDASEDVTVTLLQGTSVIGSPQVLTGASGSAPYSQTYSFATVPAGTYTLKVEKKGHAPWTEEITVDSSAVTKDVTVYLIGDVNKDGEINVTDIVALINHVNGTAPLTGIDHCDLDGDGQINVTDVVILINHVNGSAPMS